MACAREADGLPCCSWTPVLTIVTRTSEHARQLKADGVTPGEAGGAVGFR